MKRAPNEFDNELFQLMLCGWRPRIAVSLTFEPWQMVAASVDKDSGSTVKHTVEEPTERHNACVTCQSVFVFQDTSTWTTWEVNVSICICFGSDSETCKPDASAAKCFRWRSGTRRWSCSGCEKVWRLLVGAEGGVCCEHFHVFFTNVLQKHCEWQESRMETDARSSQVQDTVSGTIGCKTFRRGKVRVTANMFEETCVRSRT